MKCLLKCRNVIILLCTPRHNTGPYQYRADFINIISNGDTLTWVTWRVIAFLSPYLDIHRSARHQLTNPWIPWISYLIMYQWFYEKEYRKMIIMILVELSDQWLQTFGFSVCCGVLISKLIIVIRYRHWWIPHVSPLTAKLFNLNFHPLEIVSRWRDPQLQVSEN